jgi:serine/threonine protein kinase, bacterial
VIDTGTLAVGNTIRIGKNTFSVAVDPTSHTVYTANQDNTVAVIEPGLP